ncbi:MAG: hypothetical protein L6R40_007996 [Gallowayella cf. fulva]|nr:MAG: hypothetical protein L6R40_007996 [Xanthomendoza cf. fulva]
MISPTESFVDDLATRATVETYGDIRQRLISGYPDVDALQLRLQTITPPPDEEEDDEESRVLEAQARQDLESDGCPPCYPPHLDVPVRNPPEEYRQIIEYWQSFSSTDDVVLCAQRSDWRKFRQAQRRLRHHYRNKSFSIFVDEVRGRRRAHSLDDNVHLLLDPQQQSRQQNWTEFQDYHLQLHEWQEKKRDGLQKDLDNTQKEAGDTDMEGSEHAAQQERAIHQRLEYAETTLRWHEVILSWIEQCRLAMDPLPPTPVEKGSGYQNPSSNRQRRSKRPNTLAVLGKVTVSKSTPKGQNIRTRTIKTTISTPISVDSAVTIPSSTQQMPKRREIKPRRAKEKALGQLLPQRVAKANRFEIEQGLNAGRPLSGYILRLGPSRPEINGYQGSQ